MPLAKDLEPPLGPLAHDAEAMAALAVVPGRDELAHRDALVIERQALFLRLLFPRLPVLPILVAGPPHGRDGYAPAGDPAVEAALEALRRVLALPGPTLILAAADCSSARAESAESLDLGRGAARAVREQDRRATDHALALEPEEFWTAAAQPSGPAESNPLPAYLMLRLLTAGYAAPGGDEPLRGSILGYLQMQSNTDFVSATSLVFHREPRPA